MLHLFVSTQSLLAGAKQRLSRDETGATAVEYGLMVALIAIAIIVAVGLLQGSLSDLFAQAACKLGGDAWTPGATPSADGTCA